MQLLFYSRLALYYLAVSLPAFYPGIAVSYDFIGKLCWFGFIPAMMFLAFYLRPPRRGFKIGIFLAIALIGLILFIIGLNRDGFFFAGAAVAAWILTFLIFGSGSRGTSFAIIEAFVPALVYYRLMNFARASEDAARLSSDWLVPLLIIAISVFLLHGLIIYLAAFPDRTAGRKRKELALFLGMMVPLAIALVVFIPRDFIKHDIVLNDLFNEPEPKTIPPGGDFFPDDRGGGDKDDPNQEPGGKSGTGDKKDKKNDFGGSEGPTGPIRKILPDEHRSSPGNPRGDNPNKGGKNKGGKSTEGKDKQKGGASGQKKEQSQKGGRDKPQSGNKDKNEQKKKSGGAGKRNNENKGQGNRPGTPTPDPGQGENKSDKKDKGNQNKNDKNKGGQSQSKDKQDGNRGGQQQQQQQQKNQQQRKQNQQQQRQNNQKRDKREPDLRTVPSDKWNNRPQSGGGTGKSKSNQSAVMIVASPMKEVYAADSYWNDFHPVLGFQVSTDDPYNHLRRSRFLNTWRNTRENKDLKRKRVKNFYFSTLEDRLTAYEPWSIEPTRIDVRYKPFKLSYYAESMMSTATKEERRNARELRPQEKKKMKRWLKVGLKGTHRATFRRHLKRAMADWPAEKRRRLAKERKAREKAARKAGKKIAPPTPAPGAGGKSGDPNTLPGLVGPRDKRGEYYDRIQAVLHSLRHFQYRIGFDEDTSLKKLNRFMTETKHGDCTELSHSAAIMGRMAGIPSRIVTGYVAARWTQKKAHRRGVQRLRKQIKPLQKFPLKNLYLVTTAHRHAWVQFYLPEYGWVNFEATSHAKPPEPRFDRNNDDVLIPDIKEKPNVAKEQAKGEFNWRGVAIILGIVVALFFLGLYAFRFLREFTLYLRSRGDDRGALEALYRLVLMRLAAIGYPLKGGHETALEYAGRVGETKPVASGYTMLRYREQYKPGEKEAVRKTLREDAGEVVGSARRKKGFLGFLGRIFSLRGLNY